jgi:hypothetical protein
MYKAVEPQSMSSESRVLNNIKNELMILNDENALEEKKITNATGSPYLSDAPFYLKNVLYNSAKETEWKEVKSYEETYNRQTEFNLKKLNII